MSFVCVSWQRIMPPAHTILLLVLLICFLESLATGCSSSCGEIGSIRYPFRLKGDPSECGNPDYELLCRDNKTIFMFYSVEYFVTNISYKSRRLSVVGTVWASEDVCALPSSSGVSSTSPYDYDSLYDEYQVPYPGPYDFATFVNCSKEIHVQYYHHIPCLNRNSSNVFVYVIYPFFSVGYLEVSCSFLSMVVLATNTEEATEEAEESFTNIFQKLHMGFVLTWRDRRNNMSIAELLLQCLNSNLVVIAEKPLNASSPLSILPLLVGIQREFLSCLRWDYRPQRHSVAAQIIAWVLIILMDIPFLVIVLAVVGRLLSLLSIYVFLCHKYWKMRVIAIDKIEKFLRLHKSLVPTRYSYSDIVKMTSNFSKKLGQGGCGSVFKGVLPGGPYVAIKILDNSKCNGDDFISEVSTIGKIHHLNVVRLIGYCSDGSKRALVYEFMPNGSLDKYITSFNGINTHFTTEKLNEIAVGVAKGIEYLHQGCDERILHFDIKPANILLDRSFNPKVSDFGLAKLYPKGYSIVSVFDARGTIGYIAPELVNRCFGVVSYKADVYSFGMLLMKIAGGRRNFDRSEDVSQSYYPSWIYDRLEQKELGFEICDAIEEIDDMERKLCKIGLWCIQTRSADRPSMSTVVEWLEADVDTLGMPPKPFQSDSRPISIRQSSMGNSLTELSIISESDYSSLASVSVGQ